MIFIEFTKSILFNNDALFWKNDLKNPQIGH